MKFYLIVAKGHRKGTPIPISIDLFLIGSDSMCQLRNSSLGTKHCALIARHPKVFIRDLDSGEPTIINGDVMPTGAECPLHAGDLIEVGPLQFMIQYREKPLSQRDLEEWAARCLDVDGSEDPEDDDDIYHPPTTASAAAQGIIDILQRQKGLVKGRLRIGLDSGITTVRFSDRRLVDESEIALVKKELCDNLGKPNLRVLLDLKNVRRISSSGLVMLMDVNRWLRPWGSSMALCRVRPEISAILSTLHLEKIPHYPSKEAALAARW